jgi:flagellar basal body-associated protein FliL
VTKALKVGSAILAVLGAGFLAFRYGGNFKWSVPWSSHGAGTSEISGEGDVGPVVHFDPFLVTEWADNGEHVTTVTFEVEVSDDEGRDAVKARTSEIRSAILTVLADTHLDDIGDPADYDALKRKVLNRIQPFLPTHPIRRVLITEFLTQ